MSRVYLSGNWHRPDDTNDAKSELMQRGASFFEWTDFKEMTLRDNAVRAIETIDQCTHFAAVLSDAQHRYQGTLELMAAAIALRKPVSIFVALERTSIPTDSVRGHRWAAAFDRFLLYHPRVCLFDASQYSEFLDSICPPSQICDVKNVTRA